jgi:CubicO group peptidase (beta-lactamase class C family)
MTKPRAPFGLIALAVLFTATPFDGRAQSLEIELDAEGREHVAAMAAHNLCSGLWVVGRDYQRSAEEVLEQDVKRFAIFQWQDDFQYEVDAENRRTAVWGEGVPRRRAVYNSDQGCTILPRGAEAVFFEPVPVPRNIPDRETTPWPTGDVGAYHEELPPEIDAERLEAALDWAMAQEGHNTRALVVVYKGKIVGERYAPGFTKNTPQISWSQGKSIAATLMGVLIQQGALALADPAPVPEWQEADDPRKQIRIMDLLRMSSGLGFENLGLFDARAWTAENEHFVIYFDAVNVFDHAVNQPQEIPPDSQFRYRNSDPLTVTRIAKQTVEARGENFLLFPQRAVFDRIGARNFVLETDAWGNFIISGYDFGSAWDWARFGLLYLNDGMWEGERILPEGWTEFVSTPAPADPRMSYGGFFWLNRGGMLPRAPEDAFSSAGFMGQYTVIIPSREMVLVRLGPDPGNITAHLNDIVGEVLDAFEKERLD